MAGPAEPLKPQDVIKTYRYLRIGMIGAVVFLAASIAIERSKVDCWQTSISAYYYTPVRAIFVGSLIAIGLSLIVYKGRSTWEDVFLNFAGMFAPVVAIAPTTDVGKCWSLAPTPRPLGADGSLNEWVVTNIDNNINALLIAGVVGLIVAAIIAIVVILKNARKARKKGLSWRKSVLARVERDEVEEGDVKKDGRGTILSLVVTFLVLLIGWLLIENWGDFNTRAHGFAALLTFVFLIGAIVAKVREQHWDQRDKWFWIYTTVAGLMVLGGILISTMRMFGEHTVYALETYELALFAFYWIVQTAENWKEKVIPTEPVGAEAGVGQRDEARAAPRVEGG